MSKDNKAVHPRTEEAGHSLRKAIVALDAGCPEEAIREFMQVAGAVSIPSEGQMIPWLLSKMGKDRTEALVRAFVRLPCFYCKKGRATCEWCRGEGSGDGDETCSRCLGMGVERCDFCDGSGRVTVNYVPRPLRPIVLLTRARQAIKYVRSRLPRPIPQVACAGPAACVRSCHLEVLTLDQCMGVFENVLVGAGNLSGLDSQMATKLEEQVNHCVRLAERVEPRLRAIFLMIATAERLISRSAGRGPSRRRRAEFKAEFYEHLADPSATLAGTGIEHPFLHHAIRQARISKD